MGEKKKKKKKSNKKYSLFCVYSAYSIACSWPAVTVHNHGLLHNRLKTLTISHYSADFITEHPSFPEKPLKRKKTKKKNTKPIKPNLASSEGKSIKCSAGNTVAVKLFQHTFQSCSTLSSKRPPTGSYTSSSNMFGT